jgi:hypothetical protein
MCTNFTWCSRSVQHPASSIQPKTHMKTFKFYARLVIVFLKLQGEARERQKQHCLCCLVGKSVDCFYVLKNGSTGVRCIECCAKSRYCSTCKTPKTFQCFSEQKTVCDMCSAAPKEQKRKRSDVFINIEESMRHTTTVMQK